MSCGYKKTQPGARTEGNGESEHYLMSDKLDTSHIYEITYSS